MIYSHPEVASVGLTEQEPNEQGLGFQTQVYPFTHNARAMMLRAGGQVKVLAAKDEGGTPGEILGVHIVGPRATDLIPEGQLVYNWDALPSDVAEFIHAHPTLADGARRSESRPGGEAPTWLTSASRPEAIGGGPTALVS